MIVKYMILGLAASVFSSVSCAIEKGDYFKGTGLNGKNNKKDLSEAQLVKDMQAETGINLNLENLFQVTNKNIPEMVDIEEDEEDRFITKRNGELRHNIFSHNRNDNDWDEGLNSAPVRSVTGSLIRKKRCGGGGGDDDDGDADRSRRSRRTRRIRKKVKKNKKNLNASSGATMKTIKVIQNGQVVSQTVQYSGEPTTVHHQIPSIQSGVHIQHPAVQHQQVIAATTHGQLVQPAAGVIVQQPTVQHIQPPVVHVQQPLVQ